jgi:hypothetical protein
MASTAPKTRGAWPVSHNGFELLRLLSAHVGLYPHSPAGRAATQRALGRGLMKSPMAVKKFTTPMAMPFVSVCRMIG